MKPILKTLIILVVSVIIVYFSWMLIRFATVERSTQTIETDHFTISYQGVSSREAQKAAEVLEDNYERVRSELGDPERPKVNVFIHGNQDDFNKATGLIGGRANGTSRGPNEFHVLWTNWFNSIFPDDPLQTSVHEFAHCVQLNILVADFLKNYERDEKEVEAAFEKKYLDEYPQWFWEAISVYEAKEVNRLSVKYAMTNNPTLDNLNSGSQIYLLGYPLIEFIVEKWGRDKLRLLIRSYVDFELVLGISKSDFQKQWLEFMEERY